MSYVSLTNPYGNQIIDIAKQVRTQYPTDWGNAHNHQPSGNVYIRRVAWAVHLALPQLGVGLNGKRGNPQDMSQDILAFRNDTGCVNACAPGWLELRDIIGNAGTSQASLVYGDVTQKTIDLNEKGCWIAPEPVGGEPVPIPEPVPEVPPYPGDPVFDAVGVALFADYAHAGNAPDPQMGRWFGRTIYDWLAGVTPTLDASIAKHRADWRAALGLPPL